MTNIVFIGDKEKFLEILLKDPENFFLLLVVFDDTWIEKYKNHKAIKQIVTLTSVSELGDLCDLKYEEITKYKHMQFRVESSLTRSLENYQQMKYMYYKAFCFWQKFFTQNRVDYILLTSTNHGGLHDEIPIEMAKIHKIMCYTIEPDIYNKSFLYNNTMEHFVYYPNNRIVKDILDSTKMPMLSCPMEGDWIVKIKKYIYEKVSPLLIEFLKIIKNHKLIVHPDLNFHYTIINKIKGFIELKYALSYMLKQCVKFSTQEQYVFYSLNFDPDALGNSARHEMESQLIIIEMLSKTLPEGWILYVKEHPYYLSLNKYGYDYFFNRIGKFRNKYFYKKIGSFHNVRMLSPKVLSEEIIKHAQGVAMLQGTNSLYALQYQKPLLLFSNKTPVVLLKEVYTITSFTQCQQAMLEIEQGKVPLYKDIDILDDYLIDQDEDEAEHIMAALHKDWETNAGDK